MDKFNAVLITDDSVSAGLETTRSGNPSSFQFPATPASTRSQSGKRNSISVTSALAATPSSSVAPSSPRSNQAKFDQMMEAQMISDILRANTSLRQFKAFRVANEKLYKDKMFAEARHKEIKEPLEAALMEIEILTGKLARREELIGLLRKQIYNEIIHGTQVQAKAALTGTDEMRLQHLHDVHASDELKTEELMDKIEAFKPVLVSQQQQITKLKTLVATQAEKIRHLFDEIDKMEILQKDQKRIFDTDKETFQTLLEARENKIETLLDERADLQERLRAADRELAERRAEAQKLLQEKDALEARFLGAEETQRQLQEELSSVTVERDQLAEEQTLLVERGADLQSRYDHLVQELDMMVEEGFYIPAEDTCGVGTGPKKPKKKGAKGRDRRRASTVGSVVSSSARSKKSRASATASVVSASTMSSQDEDDLDADFDDEDDDGTRPPESPGGRSRRQSSNCALSAGRFALRKAQEDALLAERLQTATALRQKEALVAQVSSLEASLATQKAAFEEERRRAAQAQDGLTLGQRILTTEISKLTNKLTLVEKENGELKDELQVYRTTNTLLQTQLNTLPLAVSTASAGARKGQSLFQRISMLLAAPPDEETQAVEAAVENFVAAVTPQVSPDHKAQRRVKRRQFFDEIKGVMRLQREDGNAGGEDDASGDTKEYTPEQWAARSRRCERWRARRRAARRAQWAESQAAAKEAAFWAGEAFEEDTGFASADEEEDADDRYDSACDSGYNSEEERAQAEAAAQAEREREEAEREREAEAQRVDLLHYMFAWENVQRNSVESQCGAGFDPDDVAALKAHSRGLQFDGDDFLDYLETHGLLGNDEDYGDGEGLRYDDDEVDDDADDDADDDGTDADAAGRVSGDGAEGAAATATTDAAPQGSAQSSPASRSRKRSRASSTSSTGSEKQRRDTGRPPSSQPSPSSPGGGGNGADDGDAAISPNARLLKRGGRATLLSGGGGGLAGVAERDALLRFKQAYGAQVAALSEGLVDVARQTVPRQKLALLEQAAAHSDEAWQTQLVAQDLLVGLDIEWQVRHALRFIVAANDLRNRFVGSFASEAEAQAAALAAREARRQAEAQAETQRLRQQLTQPDDATVRGLPPRLSREEKQTQSPLFDADFASNLKVWEVVRCLDVVLQTLHHLLSPLHHLRRSDYDELQRIVATTWPPLAVEAPAPPRRPAAALLDDFHTFRLTETHLSADVPGGAPRGVLSAEFATRPPGASAFLQRSTPRQLPKHVDQILDLLERHSRASSPAPGSRGGVRRVQAPPSPNAASAPSTAAVGDEAPTDAAPAGLQEQILRAYREQLSPPAAAYSADAIDAAETRVGLRDDASVDSGRGERHIDNMLPRAAVSLLLGAGGVACSVGSDSLSLSLTLDDAQTAIGGNGDLRRPATHAADGRGASPSGRRTAGGAAAPQTAAVLTSGVAELLARARLHNPLFGTHSARPFSSPIAPRPAPAATSAAEYLDYTRYVFSPRDAVVSAYRSAQPQPAQAAVDSAGAARPKMQPTATVAKPSPSPPHRVDSAPPAAVALEFPHVPASAVAAAATAPPPTVPLAASLVVATKPPQRGNKAPPRVLAPGRRLRSASPPPVDARGVAPELTQALSLASSLSLASQSQSQSLRAQFFPALAAAASAGVSAGVSARGGGGGNQLQSDAATRPLTSSSVARRPQSSASGSGSMIPQPPTATVTRRPQTAAGGEDIAAASVTGARLVSPRAAAAASSAGASQRRPSRPATATQLKATQFYAPRVERSFLAPAAAAVSDERVAAAGADRLEDQSLTLDILHDVRFFPPPSQPLPPAYHSLDAAAERAASESLDALRVAGSATQRRPATSTSFAA